MSQLTESPARQHARAAAIAAAGVAAVLLLQDVISAVMTAFAGYSIAGAYPGDLWPVMAYGLLTLVVFALGVWISLWRLAPIDRESTLAATVLRGLVAAGVGAGLVLVVNVGFGLVGPLSGTGSLFGNSFPELNWSGMGQAVGMAVQGGVAAFVQHGPIVVLVALLLWIWLGKHPSRHAGSTDAGGV